MRDIALNLPNDLQTLAQQGTSRFGELYEMVHRREASRPNALWQADHAQLDISLLREDGSACRPWLTAVIDDYSRSIAGYFLSFDPPSSLRTSLAVRQAIWRKAGAHWQVCGIPDILYVDNGADFVSKHLEQVAVDLKIRLVFSTPGKPQGRGKIERFFRTVNEDGRDRGRLAALAGMPVPGEHPFPESGEVPFIGPLPAIAALAEAAGPDGA